jgi:predicted peroxiredoxin
MLLVEAVQVIPRKAGERITLLSGVNPSLSSIVNGISEAGKLPGVKWTHCRSGMEGVNKIITIGKVGNI